MLKLFKFITLVIALMMTSANAADPPKEILEGLSSERFEDRNEANEKLRDWALNNLKTSPEALFRKQQLLDNPEVKARCYTIMKEAFITRLNTRAQGFIGIGIQDKKINEQDDAVGIEINNVVPGLAGEKFGLKVNDVIIKLDNIDFTNAKELAALKKRRNLNVPGENDLRLERINLNIAAINQVTPLFIDYVKSKFIGDRIQLEILRGGEVIKKAVVLAGRPDSVEHIKLQNEHTFEAWYNELNQ